MKNVTALLLVRLCRITVRIETNERQGPSRYQRMRSDDINTMSIILACHEASSSVRCLTDRSVAANEIPRSLLSSVVRSSIEGCYMPLLLPTKAAAGKPGGKPPGNPRQATARNSQGFLLC